MVLQYVARLGRITRREAAALCQVGPYQATRLLKRLVKEGKLETHGTGKGAWYGPRS
jgi:ATP-dependent DNA helicase RecG